MSSSMSMEGAELVDGMAAEVDSVGSQPPTTKSLTFLLNANNILTQLSYAALKRCMAVPLSRGSTSQLHKTECSEHETNTT